ncbi:hypothetical protein PCI56_13035 [Plesiomonas shigelloides subsp. oncorhynchi]|nr:hypothetical protein [Plesiomonas shigelloides]
MTIKSLLLTEHRIVKKFLFFGSKTTVRAIPVATQTDYIMLVTSDGKTEKEKAIAAAELVLGHCANRMVQPMTQMSCLRRKSCWPAVPTLKSLMRLILCTE